MDLYSVLHEAAKYNQLKVIRFLIESKLKNTLESNRNDGGTILHIAANGGFFEMLKWLITETDAKSGMYARSGYGHTPVSHALCSGHTDIIKWLITNKHICINADIWMGRNIFHLACIEEDLPLAKWLLKEGGANVNVKSNRGVTALHWSLHLHIIEFLIDEANANLFDKAMGYGIQNGKTPLQFQISQSLWSFHLPTDEKQLAIIRALLERGAGIKEDFSGINYLNQLDMSHCVLIGATANGKPVNCKGAIHNNEELLEAISNGVKLNLPALQKAIVARLKQIQYDKELIETLALLNKFSILKSRYDLDLNEAYALTKPGAFPWVLQGHLTQNQLLPLEIIVKIGSFLMELSDVNTRKVFNAIFTKLFPEKNIYKFFTPNDQNNKLENQESSEVKQQFALNHS